METEEARATLYAFVKDRRHAVIATASNDGVPEAALINIAVTPDLEIVFETTSGTRKYANLMRNPRVCLVIGWEDDRTLQLDGFVDVLPEGREYERLKAFYVSAFPQKSSHEYWPGNDYYRVRPRWARLSNYNFPRKVEEFSFPLDESLYPLKRSWWARLRAPRRVSQQRN
jgi:hypothetical protein